jgi:hypothetical protein
MEQQMKKPISAMVESVCDTLPYVEFRDFSRQSYLCKYPRKIDILRVRSLRKG